MIQVSRIIDKSVLDKVDTDLLIEQLPQVDRDIFIVYCATKQERDEDTWEKDGTLYFQIVLDYAKVVTSTTNEVVTMMKQLTLEKLRLSARS